MFRVWAACYATCSCQTPVGLLNCKMSIVLEFHRLPDNKSYPISRYWLHLQIVRSPYSLLRPKIYPLIRRRLFPVRFWMYWIANLRLTAKIERNIKLSWIKIIRKKQNVHSNNKHDIYNIDKIWNWIEKYTEKIHTFSLDFILFRTCNKFIITIWSVSFDSNLNKES